MNTSPASDALIPLIVADIYELAGLLRAHGESIARDAGQTQARWQVMSAASAEPKTVPQIARRLGVTRQNVQRVADLLVDEGAASFEPNPDHRGSPFLVLSAQGRAALARIGKAAGGYHARMGRRIPGADIATLHRGLRRLIEAIAETDPIHPTKRGTKP
jgi:DNA-binding MarR family transcriptional regulator